MDANGTRFHLLLGRADWGRCLTAGGRPALDDAARQVAWNEARHEVTIWPREFRFGASAGERRLAVGDRRGAARDRFGNWYWIAPDRRSILVRSAGSRNVSTFWPPEGAAAGPAEDEGDFRAAGPRAEPPLTLQGLAVTEDHYLVVGTVAPGGIAIHDLYSGGPARRRIWPAPFEPFDLAAREGGGIWVLDRAQRRVWQLDRRFEVVVGPGATPPAAPDEGGFESVGEVPAADVVRRMPLRAEQGWPVPAADATAVAAVPGGRGVLVLEPEGEPGFARVHWLEGGVPRGQPASTSGMAARVEERAGEPPFTLVGHDFALVPPPAEGGEEAGEGDERAGYGPLGRLFVVSPDGNQAFAFDLSERGGRLAMAAAPAYYPMRLFGGLALAAAGGSAWYDSDGRWVPLVRQNRPRYAEAGELWTPVLDGGEPACVWHRLMLDACIPPGAAVDVYTRAADDWRELTLVDWLSAPELDAFGIRDAAAAAEAAAASAARDERELAEWRPEPAPYLRGDGPELPYLPRESGAAAAAGRGTWELLFQRARGRYLQIRLVLRGNGRVTPRVRALRAWYPRFSYLDQYLPAVYREDPQSASFLDRFLANVEGIFTATEDRIAAAQLLFDVASAPPEALDWLGGWFGVAMDPSWEDERRRLFLRHAMDFYAARGTVRGVQMALRLALDECVDDRLFAAPGGAARRASPVRVVERFRARRTPRALLGDVGTAVPGPRRVDAAARWRPALGGAELLRRFREALPGEAELPVSAAAAPAGWRAFAERELGFVPGAGAAERGSWRRFLQRRHGTVGAVNVAHGSAWASLDDVRLPADEPASPGLAADWRDFLAHTPGWERRRWQEFLARRYRGAAALNGAWRTHWSALAAVSLPDALPPDGVPLADWFQFEGTVLAMHAAAHRFTVMLPVPRGARADAPAQRRRLALARAVLDLEKPAHTVYDVRYYWAMFRLGEARLGDDTLIDAGGRSPALMPPMVLGEGYLAEAHLAARPGDDAPERVLLGRDRVGRSGRLGGP